MALPLVVVVRGSASFIERVRAAIGDRARLEAVSLRMVPMAIAEWKPALVIVPKELHGEKAARLRAQGTRVIELDNDAPSDHVAMLINEALSA